MYVRRLVMLGVLIAAVPQARAQELDPAVGPEALQTHAFVSQGFMISTENNYLTESERGSFEFAEVGINFTKPLTDELRVGLQLFARDLGTIGNYDAKLDWFYLDYRWADWLGIRAGRVKVPFGLYNEVNDIDSARVPILLPQSLYPVTSRDFLLAQTGVELYGDLDVGAAGALEYRGYGGTMFVELPPGQSGITKLDTPYVVGGRIIWETPLHGLRAGGSVEALRLDADLLLGKDLVSIEVPATLWVGSLEYSVGDLLLSVEYGRWHVKLDSNRPDLYPPPPPPGSNPTPTRTTSERFYAMASYRVNRWLTPGAYYSQFSPRVDKYNVFSPTEKHTWADVQRDLAATLRFDINDNWLVKVEGHYMRGTASLNRALNDNKPLSELERDWALFLVKTTAYF